MLVAPDPLSALRRAVARLERDGAPAAAPPFSTGASGLDAALGGGLPRAALHEAFPVQGLGDAAAAASFALGLALQIGAAEAPAPGERLARPAAARREEGERTGAKPLVWIRQDLLDHEIGGLYGAGLAAFGLDPARLVLVRAPDGVGALKAAGEAARCPGLGAVLIEIWGEPKALDLSASRRLSLLAARSGVTLFLIRPGAKPGPSAAATRWAVAAAPSVPLEADAPGRPAFAVTLLRHRSGLAGRTWHLEWDRDRRSFDAPLSRAVPAFSADGPLPASPTRRQAG